MSILYGDGESIWTILSYSNPRFMNQVQIWLFVPCLFIALHFNKIKYWIPFILNYSLVFALDARGLFIASTCGLILWAILDKKLRTRILKAIVIGITLGYITKWLTLEPFPAYLFTGEFAVSGLSIRTSDSGRLHLWDFAFTNLSFWGHGGDAFACNSPVNARPHNSLILVAFNWGLIPAICYLILVANLLINVIKTNNAKVRMWGVSLLSGVAYSFISGVLDSPLSQLFAVLTLGMLWSNFTKRTQHNKNKLISIFIIVLSSLVIFTVSFRILDRIENKHFLADSYVPEIYFPQFWLGNNCVGTTKRIE
ncbi:O-antigen ligase family protein [Vibrio ishigakensis]|uniref:O-antigen ligase family protein n=1 Tax=Vibrio ishigakensis TaxID=1481914 RepID=UPI0021C2C6B7|nr:hypothetical protein [Vibrio ishigakensis]